MDVKAISTRIETSRMILKRYEEMASRGAFPTPNEALLKNEVVYLLDLSRMAPDRETEIEDLISAWRKFGDTIK